MFGPDIRRKVFGDFAFPSDDSLNLFPMVNQCLVQTLEDFQLWESNAVQECGIGFFIFLQLVENCRQLNGNLLSGGGKVCFFRVVLNLLEHIRDRLFTKEFECDFDAPYFPSCPVSQLYCHALNRYLSLIYLLVVIMALFHSIRSLMDGAESAYKSIKASCCSNLGEQDGYFCPSDECICIFLHFFFFFFRVINNANN